MIDRPQCWPIRSCDDEHDVLPNGWTAKGQQSVSSDAWIDDRHGALCRPGHDVSAFLRRHCMREMGTLFLLIHFCVVYGLENKIAICKLLIGDLIK